MGGTMPPEWWREYRRRNRERLAAQQQERRRRKPRVRDYAAEWRAEVGRRGPQAEVEPLPLLMAHLQHGSRVAFWEDELRLDLAQEEALALLEGRDPAAGVRAYRARETAWRAMVAPLLLE
jgi:hypothetical protein